ncbi:MAG: hypothetical protein AAFU66_07200 [Pseudomonadota bacterium]
MITKDPKPLVKLGCTEPALGVRVSQRLDADLVLPEALRAHVEGCLACQLEYRRWRAAAQASSKVLRPELTDTLVARAVALREELYGAATEAKKERRSVMKTFVFDIEDTDDAE